MPNQADFLDIANSSPIEVLRDIWLRCYNWNYLTATQPTGMSTAAEALYQFDGSGSQLNDRMGNGHNFTKVVGDTFQTVTPQGLVGLGFKDDEQYITPIDSGVQITGALTVEVITLLSGHSGSSDTLIVCGNGGNWASEADNKLYGAYLSAGLRQPWWLHEYSASGTDSLYTFPAIYPVGIVTMATFTRNSLATTVKVYENGYEVATYAGLTAPTGGGNGRLVIGEEKADAHRFTGTLYSIKITAAEFTAAQVLESFQRAKGLI
jgi:hypothetical protein